MAALVAGTERSWMGTLKQLRGLEAIVRAGLTERPLGLRSRERIRFGRRGWLGVGANVEIALNFQ